MGWRDDPLVQAQPAWKSDPLAGGAMEQPQQPQSAFNLNPTNKRNDLIDTTVQSVIGGINQMRTAANPGEGKPSQPLRFGLGAMQVAGALPGAVIHSFAGAPVTRATGSQTAGAVADVVAGFGAAPALNRLSPGISNLVKSESSGLPVSFGGAPPIPSPQMQQLQPLVQAAKDAPLLARKPNDLKIGMKANRGISTEYENSLSNARAKYAVTAERGSFSIPSSDLEVSNYYGKLDDLISHLSEQPTLTQNENVALNKLRDIRGGLRQKFSSEPSIVFDDVHGPVKVGGGKGMGVGANDLVEIKQTLNEGFPSNSFFTKGDAKLKSFNEHTQNLLKRAGNINPEFRKSLSEADAFWRDSVSGRFHTKSLNPFWQPEDYYAYKSYKTAQERIAAGEPDIIPPERDFTDWGMTRAGKVLENLNNKNVGRITALQRALPKEMQQEVLKAAFVKARKESPTAKNLVIKAATLRLGGAAHIAKDIITGKPSPLVDIAKQAKKAGVKAK